MKQLSWYIQDRVILLTLQEDIHLEQMQAINDEIISMIEASDSQIHLIYQSLTAKTPKEVTSISKIAGALTFLKHENFGWIITVETNMVASFLSRVVANLSKVDLKTAKTLDEAHIILSKVDSTIS